MSEVLDPRHVPLWGSRLIEASAGTGKTWTIAALYLRLVLGHGAAGAAFARPLTPDQILVMTFTRAATRELSDRIRSRLVEAARCFRDEQQPRPEDRFLQGLIDDYVAGEARLAAAWRLATAAQAMDEAAVFTIDAWCQRMLREHALDSGSLFDEELLADESQLTAQAVRDFWRQQVYPLSADELEAVLQIWPTVDDLAGDVGRLMRYIQPGKGQAASLRALWRQLHAPRLAAVSALKTHWSERFGAMRDWLMAHMTDARYPFKKNMVNPQNVGRWFDQLAAWVQSASVVVPGLDDKAWERLTPEGLVKACKKDESVDIPAAFRDVARLKAALDAIPDIAPALREYAAARVGARIRELKLAAGAFGFHDMLERLDAALAGAGGERLRARILQQYPVALIDEFQDTSTLQYSLFDRLYDLAANGSAAGSLAPVSAIFLIGDPKQSIYAFRGADIHSYLRARAATAGRHDMLATNHRSTAPLVAAVNRLFSQAEDRPGEGAFKFRVPDAVPAQNPVPFIPVQAQGRREALVNGSGAVPALDFVHDPEVRSSEAVRQRFAQHCAERIVALLNDAQAGFRSEAEGVEGGPHATASPALPPEGAGPALGRPGGGAVRPHAAAWPALPPGGTGSALGGSGGGAVRPHATASPALSPEGAQPALRRPGGGFTRLRPADIAVLVRTGTEADAVRRALRARGVASVYLSDKESVFASPQAQDLLHWLRAVAEPRNGRLARAGYATATIGLSLAELAELATRDDVFEQRTELLRQLHGIWQRQGVLPMLRQTLHRLDLPARWLAEVDGERRLTNVLHLAELLQAASTRLEGEQALVRWLAEQRQGETTDSDEQIVRLESDADLVKVVTIHKSKGLEYPVVFLPFSCGFKEADRAVDVMPVSDAAGSIRLDFRPAAQMRDDADNARMQEDLRLLYVALTRARHALWVGVAAIRARRSDACLFHRSAMGYLLGGAGPHTGAEIAGLIETAYAGVPSVRIAPAGDAAVRTPLLAPGRAAALHDAPVYAGQFERDWSIGSFSALVRDLPPLPAQFAGTRAALQEELWNVPAEAAEPVAADAPRHRFPRGALPGKFLHDQLAWLAEHRFALGGNPDLQQRLLQRCARQGWAQRAGDVLVWLEEVVSTPLPPLGAPLQRIPRFLPEMEFWFPVTGGSAAGIDALCRRRLLNGIARPPMTDRDLHGMLMGFSDLVFECGGRYWVLDYKSNALGTRDADYHHDAIEAAMAEHRYDVQAALYLLALHRLLRSRLGARYDPAMQLGGAIDLFLRGIKGPGAGCYVIPPDLELLNGLDGLLTRTVESGS